MYFSGTVSLIAILTVVNSLYKLLYYILLGPNTELPSTELKAASAVEQHTLFLYYIERNF